MENRCIVFNYSGRFAHFLRAETNASAPTYPIPPRTVLIGLVGAIIGLEKDMPQNELKNAKFSVCGSSNFIHWHSANIRKIPPASVAYTIKKNDKGSSSEQKNTIIFQEWLFNPNFTVWAMLPDKYQKEFENRVRERKWYYSPSLGLSEMSADIKFISSITAVPLETGNYEITGAVPCSKVKIDLGKVSNREIAIKSIQMPREVSEKRVFSHESYFVEMNSNTIPVRTSSAWKAGKKNIIWL